MSWVYGSYFNNQWTSLAVFFGNDGNCRNARDAIGNHCFGDFAAIRFSSLSSRPGPAEAVYPLTTRIPRIPFELLDRLMSTTATTALFLLTLFLLMIFPLIHSMSKNGRVDSVVLLLAGLTNLGLLSTLDRANMIGFTIPTVYLCIYNFQNKRYQQSILWLILATAIKPQFMLIAVIFLWIGDVRRFLTVVASTVGVLLAPYLVFGTSATNEIGHWISSTLSWSNSLDPKVNYPSNYSFSRLIGLVFDSSISVGFVVPIGVLLILTLVKLRLPRKEIKLEEIAIILFLSFFSGEIVYVYYLSVSIIIISIWIFSPEENLFKNDKYSRIKINLFVVALSFTSTPLFIPSRFIQNDNIGPNGAFNLMPLAVTLAVLAFLVICAFTQISELTNYFRSKDTLKENIQK